MPFLQHADQEPARASFHPYKRFISTRGSCYYARANGGDTLKIMSKTADAINEIRGDIHTLERGTTRLEAAVSPA